MNTIMVLFFTLATSLPEFHWLGLSIEVSLSKISCFALYILNFFYDIKLVQNITGAESCMDLVARYQTVNDVVY
jgi:hypothetical protein